MHPSCAYDGEGEREDAKEPALKPATPRDGAVARRLRRPRVVPDLRCVDDEAAEEHEAESEEAKPGVD